MIQDNVYIGGGINADYKIKQTSRQDLHGRLSELTSRLRSLDRNLSSITSNICGQVPETGLTEAAAGIDNVHSKLDTASRLVASMEDEIKRLENSVGQDVPLKPQQLQKAGILNGGTQSNSNQKGW